MNSLPIPHTQLPEEVLQNLMEEFVTRDGTDYGLEEIALQERVSRLKHELDTQKALIIYDTDTESVTIVPAHIWARREEREP